MYACIYIYTYIYIYIYIHTYIHTYINNKFQFDGLGARTTASCHFEPPWTSSYRPDIDIDRHR